MEDEIGAIYSYLMEKFPNCSIEHKAHVYCDAHSFKINNSKGSLLLKVSGDFFDNNSPQEIIHYFHQ